MPILDLRQSDDALLLHELAAFKTQAVMCYPNDLIAREKMLGMIRKQTGVGRPRRSPFPSKEFDEAWMLGSARGGQVGGLLLTMVQLRCHGYESSLRLAIKLQRDILLEPWTDKKSRSWRTVSHMHHLARHREKIMRNAREYAPVAHLWAAHLHSKQAVINPLPEDLPSWPDTTKGFLRLLGYAEAFRELEAKARPPRGSNQNFFESFDPWRMIVPDTMATHPALQAMPIPAKWVPILTSYRKRKR